MKLSADIHLPSLNVLLRMHWSKRRKLNDSVHYALMRYRMSAPIPGPLRVTFDRRYSRLPLDPDNAAASAKPVLDALQALNIIEDDAPRVVAEYVVTQTKVAHDSERGFTVTIEPV